MNASTFFTLPPVVKTEELEHTSASLVQKYLTVIDLTSSKRTETTEQSAIVMALVERFKGIAQALCGLGVAYDLGQANSLSVPELYAW